MNLRDQFLQRLIDEGKLTPAQADVARKWTERGVKKIGTVKRWLLFFWLIALVPFTYAVWNTVTVFTTYDHVTGIVSEINRNSEGSSAPVATFQVSGRQHSIASSVYSSPASHSVGDDITVYVPKGEPDKAYVGLFHLLFWPLFSGFFVLIIGFIAGVATFADKGISSHLKGKTFKAVQKEMEGYKSKTPVSFENSYSQWKAWWLFAVILFPIVWAVWWFFTK